MTRRVLITIAVALLVPATAAARIVPLSRSFAAGGSTQWTYGPTIPHETSTLSLTAPVENPRPYRVTIAYQTTWGYILVGCRGTGSARVTVWLRHHRRRAVTGTCTNHQAWLAFLLGVEPSQHIDDSIQITPEAR